MKTASILVRAIWDDEARVWVATSDDIDGLAVEASTLDDLEKNVLLAIADLVALNGPMSDLPEIPVQFMSEHMSKIPNPYF